MRTADGWEGTVSAGDAIYVPAGGIHVFGELILLTVISPSLRTSPDTDIPCARIRRGLLWRAVRRKFIGRGRGPGGGRGQDTEER